VTRFRKLPIEIEAIQFTGDNVGEIWNAFGTDGIHMPLEELAGQSVLILTTTHRDPAPCRPGDWVIPDSRPGTFYPCKPEVFAATYERVVEP
jgi:hypothetical protein